MIGKILHTDGEIWVLFAITEQRVEERGASFRGRKIEYYMPIAGQRDTSVGTKVTGIWNW
jgi:hypothetical protein